MIYGKKETNCGHVFKAFVFIILSCHFGYALTVKYYQSSSIKIAAFNVQVFGQTKVSKPDVVQILVQVSMFIWIP